MIEQLDNWIDSINEQYRSQRISCDRFSQQFEGFYPRSFLQRSYYVVTDDIPKPDMPALRGLGFDDFIDMPVNGITYKNTYYVIPSKVDELRLHFHELVHVVQWQTLGAQGFIQQYMHEILTHGYHEAPLELMAYALDDHFERGGEAMDVCEFVRNKLS